jgi:DNA-binding NtrC family response regulator
LVHHFLKKNQGGDIPVSIEPEALEHLKTYSWPGNVRELANTIQQIMVFCNGEKITIDDLPPRLFFREGSLEEKQDGNVQLMKMVANLEKKWIYDKLKESDWNKEKAAKLLGVTRKILNNRITKYNIKMQSK